MRCNRRRRERCHIRVEGRAEVRWRRGFVGGGGILPEVGQVGSVEEEGGVGWGALHLIPSPDG
jgi:hypothetical protein